MEWSVINKRGLREGQQILKQEENAKKIQEKKFTFNSL